MAFRINNNTSADNIWRVLNTNQSGWARSMERLSSGFKINRAADGPASLVVSLAMRAQMVGIGQAIENSERASSMMRTADSGMGEIHSQLLAMRELAVDAANGGAHTSEELAVLQSQMDASIDAIDGIASDTSFGTINLLDGSAGVEATVLSGDIVPISGTEATVAGVYEVVIETQATQATAGTSNSASIDGIAADETLTITNDATGDVATVNLSAGDDAQTIADKINDVSDVTGLTATTDGTDISLTSTAFGDAGDFNITSSAFAADGTQSGFAAGAGDDGDGTDIEGHFVAGGVTYQADGAGATLTGVAGSAAEGLSVRSDAAVGPAGEILVTNNALTFQIGANAGQTASVALNSMAAEDLGTGLDGLGGDNRFANLGEIDVTTAAGAADAIEVIDRAIAQVSAARGEVGAFQSTTLESGMNTLRVSLENLTAADSVIRDTDLASEWTNFTRHSFLMQQGAFMLAHANMTNEVLLTLLE